MQIGLEDSRRVGGDSASAKCKEQGAQQVLKARVGAIVKLAGSVDSSLTLNRLVCREVEHEEHPKFASSSETRKAS